MTELDARGQAGGALALRPAARPHVHDRHLQRRLPDALAAREPSRALRRRRRLGGHADAAGGPNLFTYLPAALRNYAAWKRGDEAAHQAILRRGFAPGSEQQWDDHYAEYWDLTQRLYREEFDPGYDGALEGGTAFCRPGTPVCDADYDYASRPAGGARTPSGACR